MHVRLKAILNIDHTFETIIRSKTYLREGELGVPKYGSSGTLLTAIKKNKKSLSRFFFFLLLMYEHNHTFFTIG